MQYSFESLKLDPQDLALLTDRIADKTLSSKTAKSVLSYLLQGEKGVDVLIDKYNLKQLSDSGALLTVVENLIEQHDIQWSELQEGKDKLMGFFVGQAMKQTQGRANPAEIQEIIKVKLSTDD
jgi:aspartyl-tRNA(Asn)/glutamyl-tRNA(Gln) amidotransferase subunit B